MRDYNASTVHFGSAICVKVWTKSSRLLIHGSKPTGSAGMQSKGCGHSKCIQSVKDVREDLKSELATINF